MRDAVIDIITSRFSRLFVTEVIRYRYCKRCWNYTHSTSSILPTSMPYKNAGNHCAIISDIQTRYPHLQIWLDAGIGSVNELSSWPVGDLNWVIGSESLRKLDDYLNLKKVCGENHVLSLDFTTQSYQGPPELLENSTYWPNKVIAMVLSQVGSNSGPDNQTLMQLINLSSDQKIYAAGGVRHMADIQQLQEIGASGALIASALHHSQITSAELDRVLNAGAHE